MIWDVEKTDIFADIPQLFNEIGMMSPINVWAYVDNRNFGHWYYINTKLKIVLILIRNYNLNQNSSK